VIVIVFLLILLSILIYSASAGMAVSLPIGEILMLIGLFLAFFGAGVYIAVVLGALALIAGFAFSGRPFWLFMGQVIWAPSSSFVLVAVPLFLLMGEILLRTGLSEQLYKALNVWLRRWPGGLLHTNIASCAVFSAISGSSVATAATMGSVALPYFDKTPYNQRMVLGSLAAGRLATSFRPASPSFSTAS
jgi:C4-dicarboxylate transporter DctM subunit